MASLRSMSNRFAPINFAAEWLCRVVVVALLCSAGTFGQSTSSIVGTVSDDSGAVIPRATVTLSASRAGVQRTTETDARGRYQFLQAVPGRYMLEFAAAGFRTEIVTELALLVDTASTLDVTLQVGQLSEVLTVEADSVSLNTSDATVGNAFNETKVRQLPLLTRNVVELMSLQTGVNRTGEVLGARKDQNNVTLDGLDVNDQQSPEPFGSVLPIPLDSVQEFRVTTGGGNADVGRSSGGQVSLVTKSGTNQFHGSAYEFHRNTATAANTFFNKASGVSRETLIRNQYGVSLGGPAKRNRAFFFANYEGRRDARSASQQHVVPSQDLRRGILTVGANDGNTYRLSQQQFAKADPAGLGANPLMLEILDSFPIGNDPLSGSDGGQNFDGFRFNAPLHVDNKAYVARFDLNLDENGGHRVSWRGTLADNEADNEQSLAQYPGLKGSKILDNSRGFVIGYTGRLTPSMVNTLRFGFTRQGVAVSGADGPRFALFDIDETQNYGVRSSQRQVPVFNLSNDLIWASGNHNFKFGTNLRVIRNNRRNFQDVFPSFALAQGNLGGLGADIQRGVNKVLQAMTGTPGIQLADDQLATISGAALNLTGAITAINVTYQYRPDGELLPIGTATTRRIGTDEYELYFSDTWRVKPGWTITHCVRYGYSRVPYETNGLQGVTSVPLERHMFERVEAMEAGIPGHRIPSADLTWIPGGPANSGPEWYNDDRNNFAPRLSLAYSPRNPKGPLKAIFGGGGTFRVGAGVFFDRFGSYLVTQQELFGTFGIRSAQSNTETYNFSTAFRYNGTFPDLPEEPDGGFPFTPPPNRSISGTGVATASNLRAPYSIPVTATFSRTAGGGMTLEMGYVGRFGRKLLGQHDPASPLIFFRDPKSGQTLAEAFQANRTLFEDQGLTNEMVRADPSLVPVQPFFENMFPALANFAIPGSASANFFVVNNNWGRESELDTLDQLDRQFSPFSGTDYYPGNNAFPTCMVATGCHTFFGRQFSALRTWENLGFSNFHGMTLSLRKRFDDEVAFDLNYTWSHSIDNGSAAEGNLAGNTNAPGSFSETAANIVNTFRRDQSIGSSDFDIRHQLNANFVLSLPFGQGKALGKHALGLLNRLIGDWQLSGVVRYRTGLPFDIANGARWATNFYGAGRALIVGPVDNPGGGADNAAGVPGAFPDGNAAAASMRFNRTGLIGPRNIFRFDDLFNSDLALSKRFRMPLERDSFQFRWEVFNLFNNVNFTQRNLQRRFDRPAVLGHYRFTESPRIMQFALRYEF